MLHPLKSTRNHTPHRSLFRRFRACLRLEELEPRNLLSVYTPVQINHAYGIDQISFNGTVKGDGSGQTIAIVDAYYDSKIQADVANFSKQMGLAPLDGKNGDGTFTQVDLSNKTPSPRYDDWTMETALDVEWAHSAAPKANIVLVEAASDNVDPVTGAPTDLLNAVQYAASKVGAAVVSMSWGVPEFAAETNLDSIFNVPGVTFVAASGDSGAGTIWPAVSPNVVAVGGTSLKLTSSNTISNETGWYGSGGGFSDYESLPAFQKNAGISSTLTQFGARLSPDVAFDANPSTGFKVLNSADGGWFAVGGTSAGAPQWAALVAIADQGRALSGMQPLSSSQTLTALYSNPGDFHDIKSGSTGVYYVVDASGYIVGEIPVSAGTGYDMVTGLGTPAANLLVPALARYGASNAAPAVVTSTPITPASSTSGAQSTNSAGPGAGTGTGTGNNKNGRSSGNPAAMGNSPSTPGGQNNNNPVAPVGSGRNSPTGQNGTVVVVVTVPIVSAPAFLSAPSASLVQPASVLPATPVVIYNETVIQFNSLSLGTRAGNSTLLPDSDTTGRDDANNPPAQPDDMVPPPAPVPQDPAENGDRLTPVLPEALDAVLREEEGAAEGAKDAVKIAPLGSAGAADTRLDPTTAALGMAVVLALHWGDGVEENKDRNRRRRK